MLSTKDWRRIQRLDEAQRRSGAQTGAASFSIRVANVMADEKDKHTPESVAAKVVKALLKYAPPERSEQRPIRKKHARKRKDESHT